jgi:hypothetical protein
MSLSIIVWFIGCVAFAGGWKEFAYVAFLAAIYIK